MNDAAITLRNENGKYNSALAGNFWETHGLNAGGFQNAVKIYTEHFVWDRWKLDRKPTFYRVDT